MHCHLFKMQNQTVGRNSICDAAVISCARLGQSK